MSLKIKLVSTISAFFLVLGLLIMGVWSAPSATINLGGSLTFTATDVNATVTGTVKNAASTVELPDLNFTNTTDVASEGAKWANKDLAFKDDGSTITILITVTNNAKDRPLYVSVEDAVPSNTNVVDKTMKTLATADATSGTNYDGSVLTLDENGSGTYQAFIELTLTVKNVNASLEGATYGYNINLNNEKVEEEVLDAESYTTMGFSVLNAAERTAYVYKKDNSVSGDIVIPSKVLISGEEYTVTKIGNDNNPGSAQVGFYGTSITSIVIPGTVTRIGQYAFFNINSIKSALMGNGVTSIGGSAFEGCSGLTGSIDLSNVTSIGNSAFHGCSGLTGSIDLSNVTSIENNAFYGCSGLTSVTIGNEVTSIGGSAFYGCSGLERIEVSEGNSVYEDRDSNAIIEKESNTLILGCKNTDIPYGIETIGYSAFSYCSLTEITIPDSVTSVGANAFYGCNALTTVNYTGTEEEWNAINIDSIGNDVLFGENLTINYNYQG